MLEAAVPVTYRPIVKTMVEDVCKTKRVISERIAYIDRLEEVGGLMMN